MGRSSKEAIHKPAFKNPSNKHKIKYGLWAETKEINLKRTSKQKACISVLVTPLSIHPGSHIVIAEAPLKRPSVKCDYFSFERNRGRRERTRVRS